MGNRGSWPDPDRRAGYAALAHLRLRPCSHAARTSQIGLQRHTAPGTGRSATHVASRHAEELQGDLCASKIPAPDLRRKSTLNYPRSFRSAAQRRNIALNACLALANLAALSHVVTAVVKSITFILFPPDASPCWQCYLCSTMRCRWRDAGVILIDGPRARDQRRDFYGAVDGQIEP